jgi:hypothetical protein
MSTGIIFWYLIFPLLLLAVAVTAHIVDPPGTEED